MERKFSRIVVVCSMALAVCLALGIGALYLYRAYRIADVVTDEALQDNISRFMTGAYTGYREMTLEENTIFLDAYKAADKLHPWTVSTQVVAGINYRYACTDENGEEYVVTIYKPLPNQGEPRVTGVEPRLARENAESYYEAYFDGLKDDKHLDKSLFFSTELNRLLDSAFEDVYEIPENFPDWDLFLLAQDWDDPSYEILSVNGNSKEAEVAVKVRNFGIEKLNTLRLVREGDCYLIDNFIADGYNLKELLTAQVVK